MLSGLGNFVVDCHIVGEIVQCSLKMWQRNKVTLG